MSEDDTPFNTVLSAEAFQVFVDQLDNPPEPTEKLVALMRSTPRWERSGKSELIAFAKEVLRAGWEGSSVDGGTLQELGVKHGLLRETEYDPAQHGPNDCDAEPGDPWFVFAGPLARE